MGPEMFAVMVFPFAGLVSESFAAPVVRKAMDPSAVVSALTNPLLTSVVPWISNPQNTGSTVKVGGNDMNCHPFPRPSARAGEAVTAPPSMPSSAPSATMTPARLIAIIPPCHRCGLVPGASSPVSRQCVLGRDGAAI